MRVVYHPAAVRELQEIVYYYEAHLIGLGIDFLDELQRLENYLIEFPESGTPYLNSYRRILFVRFPYSLFYRLQKKQIEIMAIAHQHRRPGYWIHR
jgi:plasmid stabilization system protein ParE